MHKTFLGKSENSVYWRRQIMKKESVISIAAALLTTTLLGAPALAATSSFPSKSITIVVPYPPGGGADRFARTIGEALSKEISQSVIVDNKPGANGIIGTSAVASAEPDGYTILLGNIGPNSINQAIYPDLPYDSVKDFSPISLIGFTTHALAVNPTRLPVKSVQELIDYAKKNPGKLNYASAGQGGSPHLAAELFALSTGIKMTHIPYKGATPANTDLVAGQVDLTFNTLPPLVNFIKAGKVNALAVTGDRRSQLLPDVPTISEAGVPGYDVRTWYGIFAPAKTPPTVINSLNMALKKVLSQPAVVSSLEDQGYEVATSSPQEFADLVKNDVAKWAKVVKEAGIKIQ